MDNMTEAGPYLTDPKMVTKLLAKVIGLFARNKTP